MSHALAVLQAVAVALDLDLLAKVVIVVISVSFAVLLGAAVMGTAGWLFWLGAHGWQFPS